MKDGAFDLEKLNETSAEDIIYRVGYLACAIYSLGDIDDENDPWVAKRRKELNLLKQHMDQRFRDGIDAMSNNIEG